MKIGRETFGGSVVVYTTGYVRHVKTHHIVYFNCLWLLMHEFHSHEHIIKINISIIYQNYFKLLNESFPSAY